MGHSEKKKAKKEKQVEEEVVETGEAKVLQSFSIMCHSIPNVRSVGLLCPCLVFSISAQKAKEGKKGQKGQKSKEREKG